MIKVTIRCYVECHSIGILFYLILLFCNFIYFGGLDRNGLQLCLSILTNKDLEAEMYCTPGQLYTSSQQNLGPRTYNYFHNTRTNTHTIQCVIVFMSYNSLAQDFNTEQTYHIFPCLIQIEVAKKYNYENKSVVCRSSPAHFSNCFVNKKTDSKRIV